MAPKSLKLISIEEVPVKITHLQGKKVVFRLLSMIPGKWLMEQFFQSRDHLSRKIQAKNS
jgi:hypothetical protein